MKSHDLVRVKHMIEAADEAVSFARVSRGQVTSGNVDTTARDSRP